MPGLLAEIEDAYRAAARADAGTKEQVVFASLLISGGYFRHARVVLEAIAEAPPSAWWRWLIGRCDELIAGDELLDEVIASGEARHRLRLPDGSTLLGSTNIMIARQPADLGKLVVVLGGTAARFPSSVNGAAVYRTGAAHLAFLRDVRSRPSVFSFLADVPGLGASYAASLEAFRRMIASLGAAEIYCVGHSLGGYAALRLGLDLDARAVLVTCPMTTLDPADFKGVLEPERSAALQLAEVAPEQALDLAPLYRAAPRRPKVVITYGGNNAIDAAFACRMADVPDVSLRPLAGSALHTTHGHEAILQELIGS